MVSLRGASQISQPSTVFKPKMFNKSVERPVRIGPCLEGAFEDRDPSGDLLEQVSSLRSGHLRDPKLAQQGMSWNEKIALYETDTRSR